MIIADVLTSAASWQGERPLLSYTVPAELVAEIQLGQLVAVPYGERMVEGIVWGLDEAIQEPGSVEDGDEFTGSPDEVLRSLHAILDPQPALLPYQMELASWISDYYVTSLATVAQMMLPPGLMQRSR